MPVEQLTYPEIAPRMNTTPEAARLEGARPALHSSPWWKRTAE